MIFTKSTFSKKYRKNLDFGIVFGSQNHEKSKKMMLKTMCYSNIDFSSLFFEFLPFWLDFERPRDVPKLAKNRKNRVRDALGTRLGFLINFTSDFGAISVDLGWILNGFWIYFGRILGRFCKQ